MPKPLKSDPRLATAEDLAELEATANGRILAALIRREFQLERYVSGLERDHGQRITDELGDRIEEILLGALSRLQRRGPEVTAATSPLVASVLARVRSATAETMGSVAAAVRDELVRFAASEVRHLRSVIAESVPIEWSLERVPAERLRKIVTARPFRGRVLRDWFADESARVQSVIRQEIQRGLAEGASVPRIVRAIRGAPGAKGALQASRDTVETAVRTAATHVATATRNEFAAQNSDLFDEERYLATLDGRTSVQCRALDGERFPIGKGPMPPIHPNCRSTRVPQIKSWRRLGFDFDELEPFQRASMNGPVRGSVTGEQWLRSRPKQEQIEALGPTRWRLWAEQGVPLKQMVGRHYDLLTVRELNRKLAA
jgi:SPP1 gp7 family putative phage head morphogenesis protein